MNRKQKKQNKKTRHHLIGRCKRRQYRTDCHENIHKLIWRRHQALHTLFQTHTPKEQLGEMYEIIQSIMSPEARCLLEELINMEDRYFYVDKVLKGIDSPRMLGLFLIKKTARLVDIQRGLYQQKLILLIVREQ